MPVALKRTGLYDLVNEQSPKEEAALAGPAIALGRDDIYVYEPSVTLTDVINGSWLKNNRKAIRDTAKMAGIRSLGSGAVSTVAMKAKFEELPEGKVYMNTMRAIRKAHHDQGTPVPEYSALLGRPIAELNSIYHELDIQVYGKYVHNMDVKFRFFENNRDSVTFRDVNVRSKSATEPTKAEVKLSLIFAARYNNVSDDKYAPIIGKHCKIISAHSKSHHDVSKTMDWRERAHFGNSLTYMGVNRIEAPKLADVLEVATESKSCGYDLATKHLGLTYEQVSSIVGKPMSSGLTPYDMVNIYTSQNRTLYCFDLNTLICNGVISNEDRTFSVNSNKGKDSFVLVFANQHIYEPDALTRQSLLKKTPDKIYMPEERKESKKTAEQLIKANSFNEALEIADKIANEQNARDPVMLIAAKKEEIRNIDSKLGAIKNAHWKKKRDARASLKEALKKASDELAQLKRGPKSIQRQRVRIYVKTSPAEMGIAYFKHIATTNQVYNSDVTINEWVSNVHHSKGIEIHANENYDELYKVAQELDIPYGNQTIHALARIAFDAYNLSDERGRKCWEHSILNAGVRELLSLNKSKALTMCNDITVAANESIHGVDFYRKYASKAREGDFYRIPLLADVEPYDNHDVGTDPFVYFIETTDNILFSGNGTYDYKMVAYGLEINVISKSAIKLQVRAVASRDIDKVAKGFIDYIYSHVTSDKSRKMLVNSWIGSMGSDASMSAPQSIITDNEEEAIYYYNVITKNRRELRQVHVPNSDKKLFLTTGSMTHMKMYTDDPVRRAIIDRSRMDVVKLMRQIAEMPGCRVISVKTDCVTYARVAGAKGFVAGPMPSTFGSTRYEKITPQAKYDAQNSEPCQWTPKGIRSGWRKRTDVIPKDEYFNTARLLCYPRVFIEGFAGSGKSHILCELYGLLVKSGINPNEIVKMAFTHAAARIIDGETAHHVCGIGKFGTVCEKQIKRLMNDVKVILIDEMSMIPEEIYVILTQLPESVRIYGFGDFRQFAPIEHNTDGRSYVDTTMFQSLFNYHKITLRKQCRSNAKMANACVDFYDKASSATVAQVMSELPSDIQIVGKDTRLPLKNICYTNRKRMEINRKVMAQERLTPAPMQDRLIVHRDVKPGNRYEYERFNARKLAWIVKHAEVFAPMLSDSRSRDPEECVELARKYMANSNIDADGWGIRRVEYYKPGGRGRWQAVASQSLANITRKIRHTIACEEMVDIDMVNCHPVILNKLCSQMGVTTRYLSEYVVDRANVFDKLTAEFKAMGIQNVTRDMIKKLLLATINGGSADYVKMQAEKVEWTRGFKAELEAVAEAFIAKYPAKYEEHLARRRKKNGWTGSDKGAFVNMFMLEKEAQILDIIVDCMKRRKLLGPDGRQVVLCADGLMCPKSIQINGQLLRDFEKVILAETEMVVRLETKTMNPLAMPDDLPTPVMDDNWLSAIDENMYDEFPAVTKGMPVIASMTRRARGYHNNQNFTIVDVQHQGLWEGLANKQPRMKTLSEPVSMILLRDNDDGAEYQVTPHTLRIDFRPAYCVTAHKAQGAEFKDEYGVHEFEQFDAHGAYVAITRAQDVRKVMIFKDTPTGHTQEPQYEEYSQDGNVEVSPEQMASLLAEIDYDAE